MCQPGRPGTVMPDGRRPGGLAGLGRLPQHEIHRVALVGRDLDPRAGLHLVQRAAGQQAVIGHGGHVEKHVVLGDVGVAALHQALDQRLHLADVLRGARLDRRVERAERIHVLVELPRRAFRQVADGNAFLGGARVDLVVDVRDVAGVDDGILAVEMPQQPVEHVEDDDRARIADMGVVVDGRAADVHAHRLRVEGDKILLLAAQRVVKAQSPEAVLVHALLRRWPGRSD